MCVYIYAGLEDNRVPTCWLLLQNALAYIMLHQQKQYGSMDKTNSHPVVPRIIGHVVMVPHVYIRLSFTYTHTKQIFMEICICT